MSNSSGVMVAGLAIKAFAMGISESLKPLLAKYGFDEIDDRGWYERRSFLAMLEETMRSSPRFDLISVGLQIARLAPYSSSVDSVESALQSLDQGYRASHRNLPEGDGWEVGRVNGNTYLAIDRTPYPSNFSYGVVFGTVEMFAPEGAHVSVHAEEKGDHRVFRIVVR